MSDTRIDTILIAGGVIAWVAVFVASWHGKLGVSGRVSDTILALLAAVILYGLWRAWRRRSR
jgi:hypothetical protein